MLDQDKEKLSEVLHLAYDALESMGYDPLDRLSCYLKTSDPSYITGKNNARSKIMKFDTTEIIEVLLAYYLGKK